VFFDRALPDAYQPHLREIFPDRGSDNFLWVPELAGWVWSTFYEYQWDLNFGHPGLFDRMLAEMLFLANRGVDVLRLDAVPFIWKELGTDCENRPGAHRLIRAFNALAAMAAPALTFKSEAIVHPDQVASYVGREEAPLSYHPLYMVHLWEMLATRDTRLTRHALRKRYAIPAGTGWVNYIRGHDDIGWGFADEDAAVLGIDGDGHRRFLNAFYTGRFPGSFAGGLPFQENPRTGDCRIAGTTASLCGVEGARIAGDAAAMDLAVRRVILLHGLVLAMGGLPLIWLGDEVGRENDYRYEADPALARDARWVHRPIADWAAEDAARADPDSPGGRIFRGLTRLIALRKAEPAFGGRGLAVLPLENPHVLGLERSNAGRRVVVLANVTERDQTVGDPALRAMLGRPPWVDRVTGETRPWTSWGIVLGPYDIAVFGGG
jgi:amylosucrase